MWMRGEGDSMVGRGDLRTMSRHGTCALTNAKEHAERRQDVRYRVREGAFAVLPDCRIVGEIVDISKGGLALRYIIGNEDLSGSSGLDILFAGGKFHLAGVPIRTVSDSVMPDDFYSDSVTTRRRGIQFGEMTPEQRNEVKSFIGKHTRGEV